MPISLTELRTTGGSGLGQDLDRRRYRASAGLDRRSPEYFVNLWANRLGDPSKLSGVSLAAQPVSETVPVDLALGAGTSARRTLKRQSWWLKNGAKFEGHSVSEESWRAAWLCCFWGLDLRLVHKLLRLGWSDFSFRKREPDC